MAGLTECSNFYPYGYNAPGTEAAIAKFAPPLAPNEYNKHPLPIPASARRHDAIPVAGNRWPSSHKQDFGTISTSVNHCPKYHAVLTLMHFPVQIALSIPRTRRGLAVELSKSSPLSHPEAQLNRPRTFSISRVRLSRQLLILPLGIGGHAELIVSINSKLFPPPEA